MTEKTKDKLLQKELLDMLTPDKDKMKIGNKVFISLDEVEKILDEKISEFRKNPSIAIYMVPHLVELKKRLGIK